MTFEGVQLQGSVKIMEKLNVSVIIAYDFFFSESIYFSLYRFKK